MSNEAQTCLGRSGSLTRGRLGQYLYQTGHYNEPSFVNIDRQMHYGECLVPRSVSYTYNGFVSPVDFYAAKKVTMQYQMNAYESVPPLPGTNRAVRVTGRWQNHTPPLGVYNYTSTLSATTPPDTLVGPFQDEVPIHPRNIWGASGADLEYGWLPSRGQWLFDIYIKFDGAMLNPFDSTPRTARLMCKAHRYYSLGLNRDQTLHTWNIGLGGVTTVTFRRWLHVDPLWFMWVSVGAEYATEQPDGTELVTILVNATRLSPPATAA